jgi:hypothetical protein
MSTNSSLNQKQRLQQLFFPNGIAFDGNRFNRTAATTLFFSYVSAGERADESLVSQMFVSWNRIAEWLKSLERLSAVA